MDGWWTGGGRGGRAGAAEIAWEEVWDVWDVVAAVLCRGVQKRYSSEK